MQHLPYPYGEDKHTSKSHCWVSLSGMKITGCLCSGQFVSAPSFLRVGKKPPEGKRESSSSGHISTLGRGRVPSLYHQDLTCDVVLCTVIQRNEHQLTL